MKIIYLSLCLNILILCSITGVFFYLESTRCNEKLFNDISISKIDTVVNAENEIQLRQHVKDLLLIAQHTGKFYRGILNDVLFLFAIASFLSFFGLGFVVLNKNKFKQE